MAQPDNKTVGVGHNDLILNQATMRKVVEHWMTTRFLDEAYQTVRVLGVVKDSEGSDGSFNIRFTWEEGED